MPQDKDLLAELRERINKLSPAKKELLDIQLKKRTGDEFSDERIPFFENRGSFPLSFGQERLFFLDMLHPGNPAYNCPFAFRVEGSLNVPALERSFNEIVGRHEILRTTFRMTGADVIQSIRENLEVAVETADMRELPENGKEKELERLIADESRKPFDLAQGPLVRVKLYLLRDEESVLLLNMHHTVCDVWSRSAIFTELSVFYEAFATGKKAEIAEMPVQYGDFSLWQRERMESGKMEGHSKYWKERLGVGAQALELPLDKTRPALQTFRGKRHFLSIPSELYAGLKELGNREGSTSFMSLLAAFGILLYRYSGQEDIRVGSFVANRDRPEVQNSIGFFLNTLIFRMDLSGNPSCRNLLKAVRETALEAYDHADIPFEKLVEELQPERDLSRNPLFQVALTVSEREVPELEGLSLEPVEIDPETAQFDLAVNFKEGGGGLRGYFEYNTDLFHASTIERMSRHFEILLRGIVENPDSSVSDLPLLTAEETRTVLVDWNDTFKEYPRDACLHRLFEAQAGRSPDRTAVVFEKTSLTYRELNARANQLARRLRSLGAGPETIVGVYMERSLEMVVALYGILKAGGAYVPLDPEYPRDRLAFMMEDTRVPVLLTQERLLQDLPEYDGRTICLDKEWQSIAEESSENFESGAKPENLAYVIYTSGSTGRPKGVMNCHDGICNRLLWMQDAYRLTEEDRVLQKTPFSFDVSVWEFFWPLQVGASLVVARPGGHRDSSYLVDAITEHGITTLHFVPSMLQIFLDDKSASKCESLRRVILSGEALPYELQERFFSIFKDTELHNLYGPTEAAVDVSYWPCKPGDSRRFVPIGYPVANTRLYVLDRHMRPVPVGVAGELHIGGVQVARGYLNRPELTAERFVPDPFAKNPGARLYKTGDLACHLPGGEIKYLGRLDFQVKIQGNRIELGEIESALESHPEIKQAVVVALEDELALKRLAAYILSDKKENPIGPGALRSYLQKELPDYMIPSVFVRLDAFPLSPNGKVDRKALPKPAAERPDLARKYVAPRTSLETHLTNIWKELLKIDRIGIHDRFFELGGTSIQAARFVNRLQGQAQEKIYITSVFQAPTIAEYAALLAEEYPKAVAEMGFGATSSGVGFGPGFVPVPSQPDQPGGAYAGVDANATKSPMSGGGDFLEESRKHRRRIPRKTN